MTTIWQLTGEIICSVDQRYFLCKKNLWSHREKCFKSCKLVDFFLSSTNTTQQLHLLKLSIADAQILFYKSQMKKLVRSHFCYSKYGAKQIYTPASKNVNFKFTDTSQMCGYSLQLQISLSQAFSIFAPNISL